MPASEARTIYDIGANKGDDIAYYLMKAERVIAVEANPSLCDRIRERFASEVAEGRLVVENCVLVNRVGDGEVYFHIHNTKDMRSQLPEPKEEERDAFTKVRLPSRAVSEIFEEYGPAYYVKVDVEHYDQVILEAMFAADIRPPFISAEAHTIEVFDTLRRSGGYGAFKIVNGNAVGQLKDLPIETSEGVQPYTFPEHSAGPFGSDIPGPWHSSARFRRRLIMEKPGWKDVHATSVFPPDPHAGPTLLRYGVRRLRKSLRETKRKMRNSRKPAVDRP